MVEARGGDIDFIRAVAVLVSQGGPATAAESSPRSRFGVMPGGRSFVESKIRPLDGDPGHSLRADGSAAVFTMTIGLVKWLRAGAEAHRATITAAGYLLFVHSMTK